MNEILTYYWNILKKIIVTNSNPIFRKSKGSIISIREWKFGKENSNETIYFITDASSEGSGIFSVYLELLVQLSVAKNMGWVPVIDDTPKLFRQNKHTFRKKRNVMDDFFEFNNKYTVKEVLNSRNVIVSSVTDLRILRNIKKPGETIRENSFFDYSDKQLEYWKKFAEQNLRYKSHIQEELDMVYEQIIGKKRSVLGVAFREGKVGMTLKGLKESGEYKQPEIKSVLNKVRKCYEEWGCSSIYLSCETEEMIELVRREFDTIDILILPRIRLNYEYVIGKKSMKDGVKKDKKNKIIQENYEKMDFEYIKDMYLLSKCEYCILPRNCGTEVAFLKNNNIKKFCILND